MALGDGIARNKGRRKFAFQNGYKTAIDDFMKVIAKEYGTEDEVFIE